MTIQNALQYYSRKDIQFHIANASKHKEVVPRFQDKFGKRPDTIVYPNDVFELAKKGATSFHCSEEHWRNPLHLQTGLSRAKLDDLRTGFDFIIDIDSPHFNYSKRIAQAIVRSLQDFDITSISCKFSGNKGFHIGVPNDAFPETLNDLPTKDQFPDLPKLLAAFLIHYIEQQGFLNDLITNKNQIESITKLTGKARQELYKKTCNACSSDVPEQKQKFEYICSFCNHTEISEEDLDIKLCAKCNKLTDKKELTKPLQCQNCNSTDVSYKFDLTSFMDIDTVLISSRHLYRAPYSLHEKSGLVSLPIDPATIMNFNRDDAQPDKILPTITFLDTTNSQPSETSKLITAALTWHAKQEHENKIRKELKKQIYQSTGSFGDKEFAEITEKIPEELFPPCIKLTLNGIEDGKKRMLFVLVNFLRTVGWSYEDIEERLTQWNKKNPEPLREKSIVGQIRYHKDQKKKVLPPNCASEQYMKAISVCKPDALCAKISNPANYSIRLIRNQKKTKGKKEEDKEVKKEKKNGDSKKPSKSS